MSAKFEPTDDLNMLSTHPEMVFEYMDECCDNTAKLCCTAVIALLKENQCENELLMFAATRALRTAGSSTGSLYGVVSTGGLSLSMGGPP